MKEPMTLITIDQFMVDMLGYKSRVSYYNHLDDKGWPQRVYPGGKPMLVLSECQAYMESLLETRAPVPFTRSMAGTGVRAGQPKRRHAGRPAKVLRPEGGAHGPDDGQT